MYIILFFVSAICTILTVISFFRIPEKHYIKNIFLLFASFNSLWLIVNFLMLVTGYPYLLIKLAYGLGATTVLNAFLLVKTFASQAKLKKYIIIITELIALVFFLCSIIDNVFFIYRGYTTVNNPYKNDYTDIFILYFILLGSLLAYTTIRLIACYKKFSGIEKAQSLVMLIGLVIFGLHPLTLSIILPIFGHMEYASYDVLGSIYFLIAVFFSIIRYRFLDISYFIKKSTFFLIIIFIITLIYFGSIFISGTLLSSFDPTKSTLIVRFIFIIILSFFFLPIRNRVEELIEKTFFRSRFLYTQSLHQFSKELVTNIDQAVLFDLIINTISKYLKVKKIAIFLYNQKDKYYYVFNYIGYNSDIQKTLLSNTTEIIQLMAREHRAIRKIELRQIILDSNKQESQLNFMKFLETELIIPLMVSGQLIGFICLGIREEDEIYSVDDIYMLEGLGNQAAIAISNALTFSRLESTYIQTIESFACALEAKDYYTQGHSQRVMEISILIGKKMCLSKSQISKLKMAALLHDIGKIGINDSILNKPDRLTDDEFNKIKEHPEIGISILSPLKFFDEINKIILHHHERWNGFGYPNMLRKEEIPLLSRIISVADTFDAMTSNRPYRAAMSLATAIAEIEKGSNNQFDPAVVNAFMEIVKNNINAIIVILGAEISRRVKYSIT